MIKLASEYSYVKMIVYSVHCTVDSSMYCTIHPIPGGRLQRVLELASEIADELQQRAIRLIHDQTAVLRAEQSEADAQIGSLRTSFT